MDNQMEQGVYKNKRAALGNRKKDLFEQRLTLTNPSEDLEKLRASVCRVLLWRLFALHAAFCFEPWRMSCWRVAWAEL